MSQIAILNTSQPNKPEGWTFLSNHAHVLVCLDRNQDIVLREVALIVGITERNVQRIISELEEEGYIVRTRVGRRNQYKINRSKKLRHPMESSSSIGSMLDLF